MGKTLERHEVDLCARAAHEVNRTWNMAIGGFVDPQWEQLTEEQKQAARNSVIGVVTHDFNAEQTHAAWVAEKKSQGWTHGEVKNLATKEHPCLVPYSELPPEFKVKDELWIGSVRNFVHHFWRIPQ